VLFGAIINIANSPPLPLSSELPSPNTGDSEKKASNMYDFDQAQFIDGMLYFN